MSSDEVYEFTPGEWPLLVSVPHDGRVLPDAIASRMTPAGLAIPDTDWHVARLYDFCRELGANMLCANHSRYVIDLNRPADDAELYPGQLSTGLCPEYTFGGEAIYQHSHAVSVAERASRIESWWRPYHERIAACLDGIRSRFGYALLWDAHSIPSRVPRLFDGELPNLNIGTNGGRSCPAAIERAVSEVAKSSTYSTVVNGRFRGGFITRNYGDPDANCFAIQLELTQRCYMDEVGLSYHAERAATLVQTLRRMLERFVEAADELKQR